MQEPAIKEKLEKLDPKFMEDLLAFLDYLLYLQGKGAFLEVGKTSENIILDKKIQLAQKFKGDALFPNIRTSKYDVYEQ